jgi:multidrug efflux pump subunit AcrA (membrane-fusion protein)
MTMRRGALLFALTLTIAACGRGDDDATAEAAPVPSDEQLHEVRLASRVGLHGVSGTAAPVAEATLSTKLMGTITSVLVQEGDRVRAGQPLLRIDARDLVAKESQVAAGVRRRRRCCVRRSCTRSACARSTPTRPRRGRNWTRRRRVWRGRGPPWRRRRRCGGAGRGPQLYAVVSAPFAGTVVRRLVDPGSFAAPGMPLLVVQDASRLRVSANIAPSAARHLERGLTLDAVIEGELASAVIEGVVPAPGSSLYTVNALVDNRDGTYLPGGAATLSIPGAVQPSLVVPTAAVVRRGSLTGVNVRTEAGTECAGSGSARRSATRSRCWASPAASHARSCSRS